jgi:hypothetical protein
MAKHEPRWPFGSSDGGPESRPVVVDMENVVIAILADTAAAERAVEALRGTGFTDDNLRLYSNEQIVSFDEAFRAKRGLKDRAIGALVDDSDAMRLYVDYAREGRAAVWLLVDGRDDANRVIRNLVDHDLVYAWFHGPRGVETIEP